jgi:hypothetical protein
MSIKNDFEYRTVIVDSVKKEGDSYCLHGVDGWSISTPDPGFEPPTGEYKFYGEGIGRTVRGIVHKFGKIIYYRTKEEEQARFDEWKKDYDKKVAARVKNPEVSYGGKTYTSQMGEISGFGGGYEVTCRRMVLAGVEWLANNPNASPEFAGYKNIYGVINEENADAKSLSSYITADAITGGDCTGAMHQASISHIMFIRKNGWEKYCEEMSKPDDKQAA